ncbi:YchJ family protein [Leptothoe kymatousa]|uniref:YchJ family protein n=1 Tax=Leptothoe kymatousa TAU-MAC 1615 TaxID=2364775 RepID=A0ABS5XZC9_9CYAN|nr:YchJ family protein [Leptothoe kymatousa]MBT9310957.1 YchJ family protein [Leptothoe kymatousa TAU-MAC 1615]
MSSNLCPCGSQQSYGSCCEPFLVNASVAPTAEALMRSRYVAYCKGNVNYLVDTRHPSKRQFDDRINLIRSVRSTVWEYLTVVRTQQGGKNHTNGYVEFMAVHSQPEWGQLHERSRFIKENNRWFYVDGEMLPPILPKRNQPCWCGSGKKFKHCHG